MRKLRSIILIVIAVLALSGTSVLAAKNSYKAGIVNDYEFTCNDIVSYAEKCLSSAFAYSENSARLSFFEYNIQEGIEALNNDRVDFLSMLPYDEPLTAYVDYTDKPAATGFLALFSPSGKEIYYEDYRSLNGKKIAMLHDSYFESMLSGYALKHGFMYSVVYYDNMENMMEAAENGSIDAVLTSATNSPENMRLIAKLGKVDYYCAVKKGNDSILKELNSILSEYSTNEPFYLEKNYTASFRIPYQNMVALTYNDAQAVKSKNTLRVFVPDNYPMVFYNISEGRYDGIYIDILEQIAKNAGLTIEYISDDINDMEVTIESVMQGKADAILTVSGTTAEIIKATDPYTSLSYMPVADKKNEVEPDSALSIGITEDDRWIMEYLGEAHPTWTVRQFHSINAMLWAADHGKIDTAFISSPDLQTKTSLIAHPGLEIKNFSIDVPVCLGISIVTSPNDTVPMLNGIIKNLYVPGEEFESKAYMLSHTYVPNFRDMLYANRLLLIIILAVIALIIALLYWRVRHFRKLSRLDGMTRIYNGRTFFDAAEKIMVKNPDKAHLFASLDAKNFKLVNDRFGTDVGDQTLITIASKIKKTVHGHALYCRLQGDDFLIFMEDRGFTRSLLEELAKMDIHIHNSSNYQVHIKIGVCSIPKYDPKEPISIYIDRANIAKKNLEARSQNDLVYFTDEAAERLERESEIEVDMVPALHRGDFIAYYQPKYDLVTNEICGAEALVRWKHKDKGMISPGLFVPVFERNGFITEVDFCVYEQVLKVLKKRLVHNLPVATVSMNVSRCHLSDPNFIPRLEELIAKYDVPKEHIEMEITESIFSEGDSSANELVYELKKRGFSVSMDDFGSGYSSLNLLRVMPIDTLKIDKVFIEDIETSKRSLSIIEEIIAMAKRINVKTICEGIETEGQRDILKNAGCDMAQGYYYSKPLSEQDFEDLLNKENN